MIGVIEILTNWYAGRSHYELAKHTAPALVAGLVPGGPAMAEQDRRRPAADGLP